MTDVTQRAGEATQLFATSVHPQLQKLVRRRPLLGRYSSSARISRHLQTMSPCPPVARGGCSSQCRRGWEPVEEAIVEPVRGGRSELACVWLRTQ